MLVIEPKVFGDQRGYFFESFSQREFDEKVVPVLRESGVLSKSATGQSATGQSANPQAATAYADAFAGNQNIPSAVTFVQDNESMSGYGVMRGLHFQRPPFAQAKIVRCVRGKVLDVAVDIRKGSPTYGQHVAVELSEENHRQFFIPKGFAHGFAVLSPEAVFQYKCDEFYHPEADGGISILDRTLGIDWRIPADKAILSEKDTRHPILRDFDSPF